jgi:hypothetical protein
MRPNVLNRKLHYWGAALVAVPFICVISTGIMLQLKKQVPWVQPAEKRGTGTVPVVEWAGILAAVQTQTTHDVRSWDDIRRLDVRPDRGLVKVWLQNGYEVQVDLGTGKVLQSEYRRSDLIESLHDGSFFGDTAKLEIFLPSGIIVLGLWVTGTWMWLLPIRNRRRVRQAKQAKAAAALATDG